MAPRASSMNALSSYRGAPRASFSRAGPADVVGSAAMIDSEQCASTVGLGGSTSERIEVLCLLVSYRTLVGLLAVLSPVYTD